MHHRRGKCKADCIIWIFLTIGTSLLVSGYPKGAPASSCDSMMPLHNSAAQTSTPPYTISVSKTNVRAGDQVTVTVAPNSASNDFQGLLLKAVSSNDGTDAVGSFMLGENDTNAFHTLSCSGIQNSAVTHSSPIAKGKVSFTWLAPAFDAQVQIKATVAQTKTNFWVGLTSSESVTVTGGVPVNAASPMTPQKAKFDYDYSSCGTSRSCFVSPTACDQQSNCDLILAYAPSADRKSVTFEMVGRTPGYIAMGISSDRLMGSDSVIECLVQSNGGVDAQLSVNDGRRNRLVGKNPAALSFMSGSFTNGILRCNFSRPVSTTVGGLSTDLSRSSYYILLAYGTSLYTDIAKHDMAISSSKLVDLTSDQFIIIYGDRQVALQIMIHGALMVIAWVGTVSIAIFLARYFKDMWPEKTHCKVKIWFAWHRALNILTVLLTIAAFILVFVHLGGFSTVWRTNPHPILGCITTGLAVLQPIGAFFRPHPGTPKRPIFNWLHYLGGMAACLVGVVTLFFAVSLDAAGLPTYFYWILISYVGFFVIMFCVMEFFMCLSSRKSDRETIPMKEFNGHDGAFHVNGPHGSEIQGAKFKQVMLLLFVVGSVGFCAALVVIIYT